MVQCIQISKYEVLCYGGKYQNIKSYIMTIDSNGNSQIRKPANLAKGDQFSWCSSAAIIRNEVHCVGTERTYNIYNIENKTWRLGPD